MRHYIGAQCDTVRAVHMECLIDTDRNSSLYEVNQARSKCNIPCSITHKAQKARPNRMSRSTRAWIIRTFITGQVYWTALGILGRKE